jgi:hypothetical protein
MKKLLVVFVFLMLFTTNVFAQSEREKETLRGLRGAKVLVENINGEIIQEGLTVDKVQVEVELRLRKAGVRVLSTEEWLRAPGSPMLYVNLNIFKSGPEKEFIVYGLSLSLEQDVWLTRLDKPLTVRAATWSGSSVGVMGRNRLFDVREPIGEQVDKFINDYLAVNPK